ncbi:MAG: hypothetical protein EOO65_05265 [Methanosarcinales archaeon]|nr:MAG: hypothetical protein EOO65_05265 [Methanosarcinales archaeon]
MHAPAALQEVAHSVSALGQEGKDFTDNLLLRVLTLQSSKRIQGAVHGHTCRHTALAAKRRVPCTMKAAARSHIPAGHNTSQDATCRSS